MGGVHNQDWLAATHGLAKPVEGLYIYKPLVTARKRLYKPLQWRNNIVQYLKALTVFLYKTVV